MAEERAQIKVSEVLGMLEEGKTRDEIKTHYELSHTEMTVLFKHPKLKGRRTHKKLPFVIIDDTEETEDLGSITQEVSSEEIENVSQEEETAEEKESPAVEDKANWNY